jgi:hypothetical protein
MVVVPAAVRRVAALVAVGSAGCAAARILAGISPDLVMIGSSGQLLPVEPPTVDAVAVGMTLRDVSGKVPIPAEPRPSRSDRSRSDP